MDGCDGSAAGDILTLRVKLANSFWPRKLSAAPISVFFTCKTLFKALVEHFIPWLQVVDKEETAGFPRCVLVAQPPAAEELHVHPHRCADEPQLLRAHPGAYLHVPTPDEESVQGAERLVQLRRVSKVVDD